MELVEILNILPPEGWVGLAFATLILFNLDKVDPRRLRNRYSKAGMGLGITGFLLFMTAGVLSRVDNPVAVLLDEIQTPIITGLFIAVVLLVGGKELVDKIREML